MTHLLLLPAGSYGDVHPFIGLAERLIAHGHDVSMGLAATFRDLSDAVGARTVELATDEEYHRLLAQPRLWDPWYGFKTVVEQCITPFMRRQFDCIAKLQPDLVVNGTLSIGARVAHDALCIPLVTLHLAPAVFWSINDPPCFPWALNGSWLPRWLIRLQFAFARTQVLEPILGRPVNTWRQELGLPRLSRPDDALHAPHCEIGMFPAWFASPQHDWPVAARLADFPRWDQASLQGLPDHLERFLAAGAPPLVFTPGSAMVFGQRFFHSAAQACALLGRRGVLLTRYPEQLPAKLPAGVIHCDYAPFSQLLRRATCLVHHGGIGSTSQALAAGIPQLIMPMAHDQYDNAARIQRLGLGMTLATTRFTPRRLARQLSKLLENHTIVHNARTAATRLEPSDGIGIAVREIENELKNSK